MNKIKISACVSVARCGVFTPNWLFFNAYGGEKIVLGVVVGFWLFLTWPLGEMAEFMALKRLPGVLQLSS